jgi:hypothetical protein
MRVPDQSLVVFVESAACDGLRAPTLVYNLGGCATLAHNVEPVLRQPWCSVRHNITGSANAPLQSSSFAHTAVTTVVKSVAEFFQTQPFARIGATMTLRGDPSMDSAAAMFWLRY